MIERKQIPVSDLTIDTAQSRRGEWAADGQDQRLVHSLESDGLLQSLLVRPVESAGYDADTTDAEYSIIAGSRRYHAAVEAGFDSIHCRVIDADDFEAAVKSFKENEDRKDLTDQERARSIKMQYEMLRPDPPVECPGCGDEFESLAQHWGMSECQKVGPDMKRQKPGGGPTVYTDSQAVDILAEKHYGDSSKLNRETVTRLISIAELPAELQALWKQPEMRTVEEKETLNKFSIKRTLSVEGDDSLSRLGREVRSLHRTIDERVDDDAVNATNATLEALGRLNVGDMASDELKFELRDFKTELKKEISNIEDSAEQERTFRSTLEKKEQKLREFGEEFDASAPGRLKFRLNDQKYKRYHARAKRTLGAESNAEVVRKGYRRYLEQQAEKHGW